MTRPIDRPIHPWSERLSELPEGKGDFYHWGPNYTVDPVVISSGDTPSILLILRQKDLQWALPGGFVDDTDTSDEIAARRELHEETSLELDEAYPTFVYKGPVEDPRSTKNAWPETTALLWRVGDQPSIKAGDDALDAAWVPLTELPDDLYGSHAEIIRQAIEDHGSVRERLAYHQRNAEIMPAIGGHMTYNRTIVSLPGGDRLFLKQHTADAFTDPVREQHSRDYLQKEFAVYQQLSQQSEHIGRCLEIIDNHTLVLEACDARDGWHWRAPSDPSLQKRYVREVLAALKNIEQLTYEDMSGVTPAHISFAREGWDTYEQKRDDIVKLLDDNEATTLRDDLDNLYAEYTLGKDQTLDCFAHADLRQSNLAWHPEHGVRIVDWSWAGPSDPGLDTTSFLIDLAKAGIDTTDYTEYFEPSHARMLIGFWLGRAIQPTTGTSGVRRAQLTSAIAAFELLRRL